MHICERNNSRLPHAHIFLKNNKFIFLYGISGEHHHKLNTTPNIDFPSKLSYENEFKISTLNRLQQKINIRTMSDKVNGTTEEW